jgi:hypothetical protein
MADAIMNDEAAASTESGPKSKYRSTSLNLEKRVLRKAKSTVRLSKGQFRSVSALFNYHMARVLGLDL